MNAKQNENIDSMTGLANYDALVEALAAVDEVNQDVALALVDVDWFGRVNDEHGPNVGDEVLKYLTATLAELAPDGSTIFRCKNDEMAVLMPGIEKEHAFLCIEQARSVFGAEHVFSGSNGEVKLAVTLSAGVASRPEDGTTSQQILRRASDAVNRAKSDGRNKVCLAREEKMVPKTSHYTQGQLNRLGDLAKNQEVGEAVLLREALDDLLRKHGM